MIKQIVLLQIQRRISRHILTICLYIKLSEGTLKKKFLVLILFHFIYISSNFLILK